MTQKRSPLDALFANAVMGCTICGTAQGGCDCWIKCDRCGHHYPRNESCSSKGCGGSGIPRAMYAGKLRIP